MPDYSDISRNFEKLEMAANPSGGGGDPVDAAHILACLNAMQTRQQQQHQRQFHSLPVGGCNDVSITIGASTKLTIASDTRDEIQCFPHSLERELLPPVKIILTNL